MLVVGGVDATAVQLARTRMLDAADGAALDAADALDEAGAYGQGLDEAVRLTDATVQQAAAGYLAAQPRPQWCLVLGAGQRHRRGRRADRRRAPAGPGHDPDAGLGRPGVRRVGDDHGGVPGQGRPPVTAEMAPRGDARGETVRRRLVRAGRLPPRPNVNPRGRFHDRAP